MNKTNLVLFICHRLRPNCVHVSTQFVASKVGSNLQIPECNVERSCLARCISPTAVFRWRKARMGEGEWRRLYNEELNDLYCSPNIVRVIKWRGMRWAGNVARMG